LLETLDALALLAHRPQKLFEHDPLLAMLELGFFGMSEGAAKMQSWPSWLWPIPVRPEKSQATVESHGDVHSVITEPAYLA
jgi:hypothetical protein